MVKHTQTIHHQKLTNCLSVFDHYFERLALKGLKQMKQYQQSVTTIFRLVIIFTLVNFHLI